MAPNHLFFKLPIFTTKYILFEFIQARSMICIHENVFVETDRFLSITLHSLSSIELPLHAFGQYLIFYKTPKFMSSAKWIIFQLHAVTAFLDVFLTLLLTLFLWIPSPGGYPVGLMTYFGISTTVQMYAGCNTLLAVGFSTLIFFENRYDLIVIGTRRSEYRNLKRFLYFFANFAYCSAVLVYVFAHFPDQEEGRIHVREQQPCIPTDWINNSNFFIMNMTRNEVVVMTVSMLVLIVSQCGYFIILTVYHLFFKVGNISKATQKLQWKFFLALIMQVTIPIIAIALPCLYYFFAWKLRYYNQKYNNFAMILAGVNGLFTTIVMILVHQPYRQAVLAMFRITNKSIRISPITVGQ